MRRLSGQAARLLARLLHWAAGLAVAALVLAGALVTLLAWRLSQGPLELPWLVHRIEASVNADSATHLTIGSAALAWEGFRQGVDRPLDLQLRNVAVTDGTGARLMSVPAADVSLSLLGLMLGRIEPRGIEIDHARIKVYRSASGAISLDLGSLSDTADNDSAAPAPASPARPSEAEKRAGTDLATGLLSEFSRPARSDLSREHSRFGQLRRVRIVDAAVVVVDRQLGATWRAPNAEIDLTRGARGGVTGRAELLVTLGDQSTHLTVAADLAAGGSNTHIRAAITPVAPAALARAAPALAPLAMLSAPVGATMVADLGPTLALQRARMTVQVGPGDLHIGSAVVPVVDGVFIASGDMQAVALESARLAFRGHDGGPVSVLSATGTLQRDPDLIHAQLALLLDQVSFADLPRIWPQGVGGGARAWITQNITSGTARNGHVDVALDLRPDFSDATLSSAHGTLDGDGLTVYWLRPILPIEQGVAQLRILDPDTLDIVVQAGRQRPEGAKTDAGGLVIRSGTVHITGIMQPDQYGTINADITGPLANVVSLLRSPRLHLLDHQPIDLKDVAGQTATKLSVALPLENKVTMDGIAVAAQAHLDGVHLGAVVAGRDLDQGTLDLKVNNDGMTLTGQASLATIPAQLDAAMDFRAGPPSQVLQTVKVAGHPSAKQLTAVGFNPANVVAGGTAALNATLTERRDGQGQLAVAGDFADADLRLDLAGWTKPAGDPAQAAAVIRLDHDRLAGIDQIRLTGGGAALQARAVFTGGKASVLQIDQLTLGKTSAKGSVRFPGTPDGPIVATVSGTTIDLSSRLSYHAPKDQKPAAAKPPAAKPGASEPGQPWALDARFDHAIMANAETFDKVVLNAEDDGRRLARLRFDARAGPKDPIVMEIVPTAKGRRLTATASDAGRLLRALDVMKTMVGGHLTVTGSFDDKAPGNPLSGTADIEDFRIRDAPAMAKLLQAMTLYGLVDMARGPGLGFTRLIAPFRLTGPVLELSDARAFSSSLGLTAKGRIDLSADRADVDGTVVPAYFFNSLLGRVPLIGKLFSPEQGGGVFAANYTIRGPISDPTVSVNPLSALTPGFLRDLFGKL